MQLMVECVYSVIIPYSNKVTIRLIINCDVQINLNEIIMID